MVVCGDTGGVMLGGWLVAFWGFSPTDRKASLRHIRALLCAGRWLLFLCLVGLEVSGSEHPVLRCEISACKRHRQFLQCSQWV